MPQATPQITMFSRHGCHLCDEMLYVMHQLKNRYRFDLSVENVDERDEWQAKYGARVPVLVAKIDDSATELCWGRIDDDAVEAWLRDNG